MPGALLALVLFLFTACAMEGVANLLHRYGMHGFLWFLHADHHHPRRRGLERNDAFAAFFALLSIGLIAVGVLAPIPYLLAVGAGMSAYGLGYLLFHDVMFHRRIPRCRLRPRGRYLQRIVRAHQAHHRHSSAHSGVAFGFLYAGKEYDHEGA